MPSIRKNLHKFVRNLSNPAIEDDHSKRGDFLRRTICTESVENYHSRPPSSTLRNNIDDVEDGENASFILRYLRGDIQRIHPRVVSNRLGDFSDVHVLAPLDFNVCLCCTGPDEGIALIPYLGSRKIYDKSAESDYYATFSPETEEKLRNLPAMLRAAHFAKSGQQCYLPRLAFQSLVKRDAKIEGTRNRTSLLADVSTDKKVLAEKSSRPILLKDQLMLNGSMKGKDTTGNLLSKSGSCVSMTHVGTAPRALIEELLEEEEDEKKMQLSNLETVYYMAGESGADASPSKASQSVHIRISHAAPSGDDSHSTLPPPPFYDSNKNQNDACISINVINTADVVEDRITTDIDAFAEVLPIPSEEVVQPSTESKKRLSKSNKGIFSRSIHQQLLEDFPFSLETSLQWQGEGHDRACGISTTFYERHPWTSQVAGNPVADVFAICARENNAILAIADGVNWGEKARLAAQCAVRGVMDCLQVVLFQDSRSFRTTKDVFSVLLDSMHAAHNLILQEHGALSTLCVALVCPLQEARRYVACVCNVGDSFAYVYNHKFGVREITGGSHNIQNMRDMRDALGALGPVDGFYPELSNIMCSMTIVEPDDIVFLTTDGISDNFDPVIGKFCLAENGESLLKQIKENAPMPVTNGALDKQDVKGRFEDNNVPVALNLPKVSASQRHELTLLRMEDLIRNGITIGDKPCTTARDVCQCFINFALQLTSAKRHVLEDPDLYPPETAEKQSRTQQRHHRRRACERLALMPGKLDHATLVAYQVGEWNDVSAETNHSVEDEPSTTASLLFQKSQDQIHVVAPAQGKKMAHSFPSIDSPEVMRRSFLLLDEGSQEIPVEEVVVNVNGFADMLH